MKALLCHRFGPIADLQLDEVPTPAPGPTQVLIEIKSAALKSALPPSRSTRW